MSLLISVSLSWTSGTDIYHPGERNSKMLTNYQWCALPAQRALRLPRYMLLDLPRDVIHSVARFRLCVHTLRFETGNWNSTSSPTKHVLFHYTHPQTVYLCRNYAFLFSQTGPDVSAFLHQENNKPHLFVHELVLLYEQASSHTY